MNQTVKSIISGVLLLLLTGHIAAFYVNGQTEMRAKPRIAVVGIGTTTYAQPAISQHLGDSLANELVSTNRFVVIDRTQTGQVTQEQGFGQSGMVDSYSAARTAKILGAQYLVLITPIEMHEEEVIGVSPNTGIGGIGGILGSIFSKVAPKVSLIQGRVILNIQIINAETAEIAIGKRIDASQSEIGMSASGSLANIKGLNSKATQKAIDKAMKDASLAIVERLGAIADMYPNNPERPTQPSTICTIPANLRSKRIMVVIPETHLKQRSANPASETEIIKQLVNRGMGVVDQSQIAAIRNREKVLAAVNNVQAAANLGVDFGADVIIIGEAIGETSSRDGKMISTRASIQAKAIQTDTARIIFADSKTSSGIDVSESISGSNALQKAGGLWADDLLSRVCAPMAATTTNVPFTNVSFPSAVGSPSIEVMVSNTTLSQMRLLSEQLGRIPGVRKVDPSLTGNIARLSVQFDGPAMNLAGAIDEKEFGTAKAKITSLTANKIDVEFNEPVVKTPAPKRKRK